MSKSQPGELHGRAKLSDVDVRRIRKMARKRPYDCYEIADIHNVCASTVRKILSGRTWKHLEAA